VTELERDFTFSLTKYPSLIFVFLVVSFEGGGDDDDVSQHDRKREDERRCWVRPAVMRRRVDGDWSGAVVGRKQ